MKCINQVYLFAERNNTKSIAHDFLSIFKHSDADEWYIRDNLYYYNASGNRSYVVWHSRGLKPKPMTLEKAQIVAKKVYNKIIESQGGWRLV